VAVRTHEHCAIVFYTVYRGPLFFGIANVGARADRHRIERDIEQRGGLTRGVAPRAAPLTGE
jgi:hypothetical protein